MKQKKESLDNQTEATGLAPWSVTDAIAIPNQAGPYQIAKQANKTNMV
jgi:uncharacterized lipoprotein